MRTYKEEITKNKYDELSKLPDEELYGYIQKDIPDHWRLGYGWYGCRLVEDNGKYYIYHTIGDSCGMKSQFNHKEIFMHITLTTKRGNKIYISTVPDPCARFWNYETKIFESYVDENYSECIGEELYADHYKTEDEAIEGHKKACEYAIENL